jgi:hypothetical protein
MISEALIVSESHPDSHFKSLDKFVAVKDSVFGEKRRYLSKSLVTNDISYNWKKRNELLDEATFF